MLYRFHRPRAISRVALLFTLLPLLVISLVAPAQTSSGLTITAQYLYASGSNTSHTNGLIAGYKIGSGGTLTFTGQAFPVREAPTSMVQSARGAKLFAASSLSIWSFGVAPNTGLLTFLSVIRMPSGQTIRTIAINPQSTLLFVLKSLMVNGNTVNRVTTYRIASTGALTAIASIQVATGTSDLVVDPAGKYLYVATPVPVTFTGSIAQFSINSTTGALSLVKRVTLEVPPSLDLAIHPSGRFLYAGGVYPGSAEVAAFTIDPTTGGLTFVEVEFTSCGFPICELAGAGVAVSPRGNLLFYATGQTGSVVLYSIGASGGLTQVGVQKFIEGFHFVNFTVDGTGGFLYALDDVSTGISAFAVTSDGTVSQLASSPFALPSNMLPFPTLAVLSVRR